MSRQQQVHDLATLARKAVERELGETANAINGRFSCGGALAGGKPVKVAYETGSGGLKHNIIMFPAVQQDDIKQLLDACSVASFGLGSKTVTDPSYRDVYELDSDRFFTSFNLCDTLILIEVVHTLDSDYKVPVKKCEPVDWEEALGRRVSLELGHPPRPDDHIKDDPNVSPELHMRAELYKLNVYSPGGHFKAHVGTPRSQQMFGSLVVCLPSQFSGGALVTRHCGVETVFNWSSPLDDQPAGQSVLLQWAAFFSDVEHEVLPVTAGYRVTLTYNLYYDRPPASAPILTMSIYSHPFYHQLRKSLTSAYFMRGGGVLGFTAQQEYEFEKLNRANDLPLLLKGADRIIYLVAKSLGLSVLVKPVVPRYGSKLLLTSFSEFSPCFVDLPDLTDFWKPGGGGDPVWDTFDTYRPKSITWCQEHGIVKAAGVSGACLSEVPVSLYYQAAAILVGVPRWGDQRKRYVNEEETSFTPDKTLDLELKENCFPLYYRDSDGEYSRVCSDEEL